MKISMLISFLLCCVNTLLGQQTIDRYTYQQHIAKLSRGANYESIEKTRQYPDAVAFAKDVRDDGVWTQSNRYSVVYPASGNMRTHIVMDLSSTINRRYKGGAFLDPSNPGHYLVKDNYSGRILGPADCLNTPKKMTEFVISDFGTSSPVVNNNSSQIVTYDPCTSCPNNKSVVNDGDWSDPVPTGEGTMMRTGSLYTDVQQVPKTLNQHQNFSYTKPCQAYWSEKYPEAVNLFLQTRKRNSFNHANILHGPDRRKARRCFAGPSAGRIIAFGALGAAAITGGIYGVKAISSKSAVEEKWGPNESGGDNFSGIRIKL